MGFFSCISTADEDEYALKHKLFSTFPSKLKNRFIPHMPLYFSGRMSDMGVGQELISGCRICLPGDSDDQGTLKKVLKAAHKSKKLGADVVVLEDKALFEHWPKPVDDKYKIKVVKGLVFPPIAFIEAAKTISGLIGIDFKRSNVCIADAASEMGLIMTELLLNEAAYLILFTPDKEKINNNTEKYLKACGLSPVVMSSMKKSMTGCGILFYTGGIDINELMSYTRSKLLIVNMSRQKLKLERDYLVIDEVILKGLSEPIAGDDLTDTDQFLTSKVWEGAIAAVSGMDISTFDIRKAEKVNVWAKRMGLSIKSVIKDDRIIDRKDVYIYR